MKMNRTAICVALLFAAIFASTITSTALAGSKHVTFSEPMTIGSTVLAPGTYNLVWAGSGPEVQVSFMKGNKTLATASARLVLEKSPNHQRVDTLDSPDAKVIKRISFSNKALIFDL